MCTSAWRPSHLLVPALAAALAACAAEPVDADNPFTADLSDPGKEDSAYMNPDGIEVEVDLEGEVAGPASRLSEAPVAIGQFALTYLRKSETMYLESLAEETGSDERVEWQVDGRWVAARDVPAGATRTRWRLRGLNTVLLHEHATGVRVGTRFSARVPKNPFTVLADAGDKCADGDDHITLDSSVYWYRWEPDQAGCTIPLQDLTITVSKKFPTLTSQRYPEYDQLVADRKVTAVILFGQIDDGAITASETGMRNFARYGTWLRQGGFTEVTAAPVGKRYRKTLSNGVVAEVDLYSPRDFSGLDDYAHFANFQKAVGEHEIVAWDGHSMLGASDFWSRPTYPSSYQIFLYGGCLGYEYYVQPILRGKGGSWAKLDILSSVIEVTASANEFAGPALAKILWGVERNGRGASWRSVITTVRDNVGDSTFGVSGARDNCFTPSGGRC
ncbi:MAG: hypothetical protein KBG28_03275 [Kofleriaceae bacterium]|nr:hypothetical protein [Kofleriaceae bacterium]MBP6836785.1 hypothetical protein [Kofleriaceae bacterium]MBP9202982.1 hypothetical protein [Kofleriaceae bacterium]